MRDDQDMRDDQVSEERRPSVRVGVDLRASYGVVGTLPRHPARVSELSATGIRLQTSERLWPGTLMKLAFDVDGRNRQGRITLRVIARVVRVLREEPPSFEYGLQLTDDQAVKGLLRRAVLMVSLAAHTRIVPRAARAASYAVRARPSSSASTAVPR
jgi:hypothetical protein